MNKIESDMKNLKLSRWPSNVKLRVSSSKTHFQKLLCSFCSLTDFRLERIFSVKCLKLPSSVVGSFMESLHILKIKEKKVKWVEEMSKPVL
jgi:hypothetical protein